LKWIVLLILVAGLVVVLRMLFNKKKQTATDTPLDLANLGPLDARSGDTVSIVAMGEKYDDLVFTIDEVSRYEAGRETWKEFGGRYHGARVYLEVWEDDGVQVALTKADSDVSMAEVGLSEPDLIRLDESGDTSQEFDAIGSRWRFSGSEEVTYFEDGRGSGEGCYTWSFDEVDGRRTLTIEKWEGEPFEAMVSHMIPPGDVQVFRG
tara:strand:- start:205 stop:825 length:621 start_codon:yes stop_codon:yes gene_type:complete